MTCTIWFQEGKTFKGCYCQFGGNIEQNGKMLLRDYNALYKVKTLIKNGGMESLQSNISKILFYQNNKHKSQIYKISTIEDLSKYQQDYNYFFINNQWLYSKKNEKELKSVCNDLLLKSLNQCACEF